MTHLQSFLLNNYIKRGYIKRACASGMARTDFQEICSDMKYRQFVHLNRHAFGQMFCLYHSVDVPMSGLGRA